MKINRASSLCVALALIASAVVGLTTTARAAGNPNCLAVDGDYIVTFAKDAEVDQEIKSAPGRSISSKFTYKSVLNGFAATLSGEQVCAFQKRPKIESIELDGIISIDAITTQLNSTWGLDRIDSNGLPPLSNSYNYTSTGVGVTAYVIDTGIQTSHPDLAGAVGAGYSVIKGGTEDCNGHGTHVAGTIGGTTYGVAKDVTLIPVRVLDCRGSGSNSGVIAGVDWVKRNYLANGARPSVANMSLGGGLSSLLDAAVNNLIIAGVTVVVAAGNSSADACVSSPARVPSAITVAASDRNDALATFSNRGPCVDVIAPGVNITSDWMKSGVKTISGTSMASPHVAGVVARYLQLNPNANPADVSTALLANATNAVINGSLNGTANRLIYANPSN